MNQRNVPGIDDAYLAMDTEEGVEVVWNEVMISERKNFQQLEVGISAIIVSRSQMLALGDVLSSLFLGLQSQTHLNTQLKELAYLFYSIWPFVSCLLRRR